MAKLIPGSQKPLFCDADIWVAWFNKNDQNHQKAKEIVNNLPPDIPLLTSNLVIYEVLTVLSIRANKNISLKSHTFDFMNFLNTFIKRPFHKICIYTIVP